MNISGNRVSKKIILMIIVIFIFVSFVVGYGMQNKGISIASGTISYEYTEQCNSNNLYDLMSCKAIDDYKSSKYVSYKGIMFSNSNIGKGYNGRGIYRLARTREENFPTIYYRGHIDNNNIIFGDYCWKIVRTTETGGIKIIYNGIPDENNYCTGTDTVIATSPYNSEEGQIGYMFGGKIETGEIDADLSDEVLKPSFEFTNVYYYFSDSYTYSEETNKYTLGDATYLKNDSYDARGKYTCKKSSSTDKSCSILYYTTDRGFMELVNGQSENDLKLYFSNDYIENEDGTYSLVNPSYIYKKDCQVIDKGLYESFGKYICNNNSSTCDELRFQISKARGTYYRYLSSNNMIEFGKSLSYENGTFTLNDTIDIWNTYSNMKLITEEYPYAIVDGKPYYFVGYYGDSDDIFKLIKYLVVELNELNYDFDQMMELTKNNSQSSVIKNILEQWYETNLMQFENKIEDTIYCNDRNIIQKNGPEYDASLRNGNGSIKLNCNIEDSFTVSESIGNGKLTYPIGLLTSDDAQLGGDYSSLKESSYLYSSQEFYLMSPRNFISGTIMSYSNTITSKNVTNNVGVRPVISLKNSTLISSGDGTKDNPYIVE